MGNLGIISYGAAIPKRRIKIEDIINVWKNSSVALVKNSQGVAERGVLGADEDTNTLAIQAAKEALKKYPAGKNADTLYLGTCTNPFSSRPSSTLVLEALGLKLDSICGDVQFSTKSGTSALQICLSMVAADMSKIAIAIGSDTINRHTAPGDLTEPYASAGAVAFIIGKSDVIAEIEGISTYSSDLSDSFRVEGERYIRSGTGLGKAKLEVGAFYHMKMAGKALMDKLSVNAKDYQYAVFQQSTGSMPKGIGRELGFNDEQLSQGCVAGQIGDCGSASALLGLVNILDQAKAGDRIFLASYGFGAGSDAISLRVTDNIARIKGQGKSLSRLLEDKILVDYGTSIKYEYKYIRPEHPLAPYL